MKRIHPLFLIIAIVVCLGVVAAIAGGVYSDRKFGQGFDGQYASGTLRSFDFIAIGVTTSSFNNALYVHTLNVASSTATSTFANGIQLSGGCFRDGSGTCVGGGSSGANTALSNLAAVAINTALLPSGNNTIALGAYGTAFSNLFASGTVYGGSFGASGTSTWNGGVSGTNGAFSGNLTVSGGTGTTTLLQRMQATGILSSGGLTVSGSGTSTLLQGVNVVSLLSSGGVTISGGGLRISGLTNCNTIDTNANGDFVCGVDASGGASTPATTTITLVANNTVTANQGSTQWQDALMGVTEGNNAYGSRMEVDFANFTAFRCGFNWKNVQATQSRIRIFNLTDSIYLCGDDTSAIGGRYTTVNGTTTIPTTVKTLRVEHIETAATDDPEFYNVWIQLKP